jgi:hypothetical protein
VRACERKTERDRVPNLGPILEHKDREMFESILPKIQIHQRHPRHGLCGDFCEEGRRGVSEETRGD